MLSLGDSPPFFAVISPSNQWLASTLIFSKNVTLWKLPAGKETVSLPPLEAMPEAVVFSKDERHLGALTVKGEIVIWNLESRKEIHRGKGTREDLNKAVSSLARHKD